MLWASCSHLQPETFSKGWQRLLDHTGEWKNAHNTLLEYNVASASMLICRRHSPFLLDVNGCRVKPHSSLLPFPVRNKMPSFIADWSWKKIIISALDRKMVCMYFTYFLWFHHVSKIKNLWKQGSFLVSVAVVKDTPSVLSAMLCGFVTMTLHSQWLTIPVIF